MRVISATCEPTAAGASVRELALWSIMSSIPAMLYGGGGRIRRKERNFTTAEREWNVTAARTYNTPDGRLDHQELMW